MSRPRAGVCLALALLAPATALAQAADPPQQNPFIPLFPTAQPTAPPPPPVSPPTAPTLPTLPKVTPPQLPPVPKPPSADEVKDAVKDEVIDEAKAIRDELYERYRPWSSAWLVDLNGAFPKVTQGDGSFSQSFVGDALLGYQVKRWGVAARGSLDTYNQLEDNVLTRNFKTYGSLEGFGSLIDDEKTKLEGRAVFEGAQYKADTVPPDKFIEDKSLMYRGKVFAGLRHVPSSSFALGAWLGAGFQWEVLDAIFSQAGGKTRAEKTTSPSAFFEARFRMQVVLIDEALSARLRVDASGFGISRNHVDVDLTGQATVTRTSERSTQIETHPRLFFDLDVLSFAGFVPAVHGGLDVFYLSTPQSSAATVVPLGGVGIRRESF